jgi:hypothetical protein
MDPDLGGPKTCGSGGSRSGPGTLGESLKNIIEIRYFITVPVELKKQTNFG